jgi:hypothetical protein
MYLMALRDLEEAIPSCIRWSAVRPARCFGCGRLGGLIATVLVCFELGGCGLSDGAAPYMVDPLRYEGYHCQDLLSQWNGLQAQEKNLRNLMARADEGPGGSVIGTLTYRTDYETVLGQEKVLQRTAAEKKCALTPVYESDQTIR